MYGSILLYIILFVVFLKCAEAQDNPTNAYLQSLLTTGGEQPHILWRSHDEFVPSVLLSFITVVGCQHEGIQSPLHIFHVIVDACFDDTMRNDVHLLPEQLLINVIGTDPPLQSMDTKVRVVSLIHPYETINAGSEVTTEDGLLLPSAIQPSWKAFVCNALLQPNFPCQVSTWATTPTTWTGSTNNIDLLASVLILANTYINKMIPLLVPTVYRVRPLWSLDVSNLGLDPIRTLRFRYFNIISAFVGINMECHQKQNDEMVHTYSHAYITMKNESGLSVPFPAESWTSLELRMELLDHVLIQLLKDAPHYCPYMGIEGEVNGKVNKEMDIENSNDDSTVLPLPSSSTSSTSSSSSSSFSSSSVAGRSWMEMIHRAEDTATNEWLFQQLHNLMEHGFSLIALIDRMNADIAGQKIEHYLSNINTGVSDEMNIHFSYVMFVDELLHMNNLATTGDDRDSKKDKADETDIHWNPSTIKVGQRDIPWIFSNTIHFANDDPILHALVIISMSTWKHMKLLADNHNKNYTNDNCQGSSESHQYEPIITDEFITITPPFLSSSDDPSSSTKSHEFLSSDHDFHPDYISMESSEHQRSDECQSSDFNESNMMTNESISKTVPMMIRLQFFRRMQNTHPDNQCPTDQPHDIHDTLHQSEYMQGQRSFRYNVIVESNAKYRFDLVRQRMKHSTIDESTLRSSHHCQENHCRNSQRHDSRKSNNRESDNEIILLTHMGDEALMLPQWISHHASMFHRAYLLDYNSTDHSMQIARAFAPANWKVIPSRNTVFASRTTDNELIDYETMHPHAWKIVLTLGEFLIIPHSDLRGYAKRIRKRGVTVVRFPSYGIVGDNDDDDGDAKSDKEEPKTCDNKCNKNGSRSFSPFQSLISQRSVYSINPVQAREWFGLNRYSRFFHHDMSTYNVSYGSGRHYLEHNGSLVTHHKLLIIQRIIDEMNNNSYDNYIHHINQHMHHTISTSSSEQTNIVSHDDNTAPASESVQVSSYKVIPPFVLELSEHGFILKYKWSPWPQNIHKMLVINQKYVEKTFKWDDKPGMETHTHEYSTVEALEHRRKEILLSHNLYDLRHVPWMRGNIYAWRNPGFHKGDHDDMVSFLSTDIHGSSHLLSSTKQLLLHLCGDSSPHHISSPSSTIHHYIFNVSKSTCSLYHAERWIQQQTFSDMITHMNSSSFVSCSGYYLHDLRSKLHETWFTITNNVPSFLIHPTDHTYPHRSDRLMSKLRHISYTGNYEEHYLNVSFFSLLVADTFWKLQQKIPFLDDSITTTNFSSLFYANSTFVEDLNLFCIHALQHPVVPDCMRDLFLQLQLFYMDMKFI